MILLIDTSDFSVITVALAQSDGSLVLKKKMKTSWQQSEKILPIIDQLLSVKKVDKRKISGVAVVSGPGGFTSLRVGIATANALAYGLNVPVVGLPRDEFKDFGIFSAKAARLLSRKKTGIFITPAYGSEPHITTPKK